jgi:nucleoside-diphosphate-sugar epimerase
LRLFVFGYGFSGRAAAKRLVASGWKFTATFRNPETRAEIEADGGRPLDLTDTCAVEAAATAADAILITPPPGQEGCPGLAVLEHALETPGANWLGYLSTTGVYGDRRGRWVTEASPLSAGFAEGQRRVAAEQRWLELGDRSGRAVTIFRLPGIYGAGRSTLDRVREGRARRIIAPDQIFSRIHVDDLAAGISASIARPRAGGIYNLCDDEPAPNSDVVVYAAGLLGLEPPPPIALEDANLAPAARRFYSESKRVSNARAKAELGWRPDYPTYREGLTAILQAGG